MPLEAWADLVVWIPPKYFQDVAIADSPYARPAAKAERVQLVNIVLANLFEALSGFGDNAINGYKMASS